MNFNPFSIKKTFLLSLSMVFGMIKAQSPTGLPRSERFDAIDFSDWSNILFYIGLPIAFFILYKWWLKRNKNNE